MYKMDQRNRDFEAIWRPPIRKAPVWNAPVIIGSRRLPVWNAPVMIGPRRLPLIGHPRRRFEDYEDLEDDDEW